MLYLNNLIPNLNYLPTQFPVPNGFLIFCLHFLKSLPSMIEQQLIPTSSTWEKWTASFLRWLWPMRTLPGATVLRLGACGMCWSIGFNLFPFKHTHVACMAHTNKEAICFSLGQTATATPIGTSSGETKRVSSELSPSQTRQNASQTVRGQIMRNANAARPE